MLNRSPLFLLIALFITACSSPQWQPISEKKNSPLLTDTYALMSDGYRLPFDHVAANHSKATIIALHGFNDYRHAFKELCQHMSQRQINCYAYDQRGFGETEHRGLWPQNDAHPKDLLTFIQLVKEKIGNQPLYLLGESMGGAVIMSAAKDTGEIADGIILLAPAVWGRKTQSWYHRAALTLAFHIAPGWQPTGESMEITPTDNIAALRAMYHDPLVIKKTRIDAVYGITNLMDGALASSHDILDEKGLLLYGKKDELIPRKPSCQVINTLTKSPNWSVILYDDGYHMLSRDLQRENVFNDVADWILGQHQPSNEYSAFCGRFVHTNEN